MNEDDWRRLAVAALADLDGMGLDDRSKAEVRAELEAALARPRGEGEHELRAALTSRPELRAWLRGHTAAMARPTRGEPPSFEVLPPPSFGRPGPPRRPGRGSPPTSAPDEPQSALVKAAIDVTAGEPDGEAAPTRSVHARLDAPGSVEVGAVFDLAVGIASTASRGVIESTAIRVPVQEFTLTVTLMLDGFRIVGGAGPVLAMPASQDVPYPFARVQLEAVDDPQYKRARTILAEYSIEGRTLGLATTSVDVRPRGEPESAGAAREQAPGEDWAIPTGGEPDVVITIGRGNDQAGRRLQWSVKSPHAAVPVPAEPVPLDLDASTADWARRVMRGVEQRKTAPDLKFYLRGISRLVGEHVPDAVWRALEAAAAIVPHPAVLLNTAEPFVPWELAAVPRPWDPGRPAMLGAQANLGRWSYRDQGRSPSPAPHLRIAAMAVVKGEYAGGARLPEAEAEADHLRDTYTARQVAAEILPVLQCIEGDPEADVLHFAVHGKLDVSGLQDGVVMNDRSSLSPESILGAERSRAGLVFLNACQLGQQQEMLGDAAGIVPSFLSIGAQAVVAPLWKVDDAAAAAFARRFYVALFAGRPMAEFFAEERANAANAGLGSPSSTVLAYLFFGHPRLTAEDGRPAPAAASTTAGTAGPAGSTRGALDGPAGT